MSNPDESYETIPPKRYRRRDVDRVSPRRVSLGTAIGVLAALASAKPGLDLYSAVVSAPAKVNELRLEVKALRDQHQQDLKIAEDRGDRNDVRLDKVERWKCVLGWDPGGVRGPHTRNPDRVCQEGD